MKNLLDPITIAQLGNLELRARRILDGFYAGHHVNKNRGHAQDFSEHRPYNPGDDPKSLDWKIFGRTDRLVVKQYEEETNIAVMVVLDDSASMGFSFGGRASKLDYAKTLTAALSYLIVSQNDAIGCLSSTISVAPGSSRTQLQPLFTKLEALAPSGVWPVSKRLETAQVALHRRGFVVILSDLMANEKEVLDAVRFLEARKNEVLVIQVLDPAEEELPYDGLIEFEDMETKEIFTTEPDAIRAAYKDWMNERRATLSNFLRRSGMDYLNLTTDTPFDRGLGAYLSWRGARL